MRHGAGKCNGKASNPGALTNAVAVQSYDVSMHGQAGRVFAAVALWASRAAGQAPSEPRRSDYVEIRIPPAVRSEQLFVRYVLTGQDFGDGVYAPAGAPAIRIGTSVNGQPAAEIKAILYAPGCAIQTLDLRLAGADSYDFICQPIPIVDFRGVLTTGSGRIGGGDVRLQAKYIAHWAQPFLGLGNDLITSIPVGEVEPTADGHFQLRLPDLSENPLPAGWSQRAEIQITARNRDTGAAVALLLPDVSVRTQRGGLELRKQFTGAIVFAPCYLNSPLLHDAEGFAIRPESSAGCALR